MLGFIYQKAGCIEGRCQSTSGLRVDGVYVDDDCPISKAGLVAVVAVAVTRSMSNVERLVLCVMSMHR